MKKERTIVDANILLTPKQVMDRIKLPKNHPDRVQLFSSIWDYYHFYIRYKKKGITHTVKLNLHPFKLGLITERLESLMHSGRIQWEGLTEHLQVDGESIECLPQEYVEDDKEAEFNRRSTRFAVMGHAVVHLLPEELIGGSALRKMANTDW